MALTRKYLNLNGVERVVLFDPEKDTLAETLRRHGLLSVKVGCGKGMCGACNVILNGRLVRTCTRKMSNVPEFSTIETVEGMGIASNLHPLQIAWMNRGGAQCGFCTPGFLISAKALLDQNPKPTREEVRDWFQTNRNVCRCTGYKPLVDAVMDAAAVMRGEKTLADISYQEKDEKEIYGSFRPRPTALAKVLGQFEYGDDVRHHMPEGTLHAAIIQPKQYSHAAIRNIDLSEALNMPGVVRIVTAEDIRNMGGNNLMIEPLPHPSCTVAGNETQIFADKVINRYGDVVGAVIADSLEHARAAAAAVKVELDPLPEYLSYVDAVAPGAQSILPNSPSNIYMQQPLVKGEDTRDIIPESFCSVEGSYYTQKEPHLSVEGDVLQAYYDDEGRVCIQNKTQALGWNTGAIAGGIGLAPNRIRMINNPAGGSFGWSTYPGDSAVIAVCLRAVGQPITMTMTYEEHQHFSGKRTSNFINGKLACDENGRLTGLEFEVGCDHGACFNNDLPELEALVRFTGNGYVIPNIRALGRMAMSNHSFGTAYRGLGSPQTYTTFESLIDDLARKMKMDPFEFRYLNAARPGDLASNGYPYVEPSVVEALDQLRPIYEEAKKSIEGRETADKAYGIGLAVGGFMCNLGIIDKSEVALELNADGSITHYNSWEDVGQGGDIGSLTHVVKALAPLGIRPEQVHLVMNDLGRCPDSGIAAGSRSHFMNGNSTLDAAEKLMNAMRKEDGTFRTYSEMTAENIPTKYFGVSETIGKDTIPLDPKTGIGSPCNCMNYGCFMAVVEVDKHTGETKVEKFAAVGDVGVIGNRLSVEGQAYGGISHTIGFALKEEYSADYKKCENLLGAGVPYIKDIPDDIELHFIENKRKWGPHGSAGASELYQSAGHMAVVNGIRDAVGVRIYDLPARPEKVRAAMEAKAAGKENAPEKYYLGPDMFDYIESLQED